MKETTGAFPAEKLYPNPESLEHLACLLAPAERRKCEEALRTLRVFVSQSWWPGEEAINNLHDQIPEVSKRGAGSSALWSDPAPYLLEPTTLRKQRLWMEDVFWYLATSAFGLAT
ncbi:hypothetical protein H920_06037 [Fukomys damarensis]|uniref:Uncharacterized protein n=1 Tax=Fukomys damarensis TaxID=885580 RepID=A0A091EB28_FUKDA|nr:hypothetical protein H920_06037 [Fukomys damarensis]